MIKLDDNKAACNIIKSHREYNKNKTTKNISIPLFKEDKTYVRSRLHLSFNNKTGFISIGGHSLSWKTLDVYPTTNQKLKCTNKHALDVLDQNRSNSKKYRNENKKEVDSKREASVINRVLDEHELNHETDSESLSTDFMMRMIKGVY